MARYLPGLLAALLFGCSAPLITLLAGQGALLLSPLCSISEPVSPS